MQKLKIIFLAIPLFITACAPIYKPINLNKTVIIDTSTKTRLRICKNNEWYRLEKDVDGNIHVPYGKRISIANNYFNDDGDTRTSCFPAISFLPQAGNKYYFNFMIKENKCVVEILRYSNQSKIGMVPEESASEDLACLPLNE